jgi:hypothetical protein
MTRDEAVAEMHRQLGFRSDQTDNLVGYLKLAQTQLELEPELPWFLVSETLSTTTTADEPRIGVPSNMLEELDTSALFYVPSSGDDAGKNLAIVKDEYDVLVNQYLDFDYEDEEAYPRNYAIRGDYFILFPTPDAAYTVKINIYAQDTVLTSNIENRWLKYAPLLIMGKALQLSATGLRDQVAQATGKDWERQGRLALVARTNSRELANTELQIGGPH